MGTDNFAGRFLAGVHVGFVKQKATYLALPPHTSGDPELRAKLEARGMWLESFR